MLPSIENTIKNIRPSSKPLQVQAECKSCIQKACKYKQKAQLSLTKPCKSKQKTAAASASTANSNGNDSVAKLELALAPDIKPGPPETSVADPFCFDYEATPRY